MVKREPNLLNTRLGMLFCLYPLIMFTISDIRFHDGLANFVNYTFLSLGVICIILILQRYWREQEQRRKRAANGDTDLLAASQPPSDETTLVLPYTIVHRMSRRWSALLLAALLLFLAVPLPIGVIWLLLQAKSLLDVLMDLLYAIFAFELVLLFLTVVVGSYQKLVVDEQGMHIRVGLGRVHSVRWSEARLFAMSSILQVNTKNKLDQSTLPLYYEIASEKDIVRWQWLVRSNKKVPITISEPTIPFAEYNKQMQALLSLVAAKTHLALYDVRPTSQK